MNRETGTKDRLTDKKISQIDRHKDAHTDRQKDRIESRKDREEAG